MNDFNLSSHSAPNTHCSKCGAAQKPTTIYCSKCGTASLQGQSPAVALALRTVIFFGILLFIVGLGTVGGCFLLMIYLKRSAYSDATLLLWSGMAFVAFAFCTGILFRLRKL